jgi:hypothetical protein
MIRFYPAVVAGLLLTATDVWAQAPTAEGATLGWTFTASDLADLPTGGSLYSIFDTIAAEVISDRVDGGGLYTGEMARIGSHGSSWTQTTFRVGDADITNPYLGGTPLLVPLPYAWDRVDVTTGLMPAETNTPGTLVTLVPRAPSPTWIRTIEFTGAGPWLEGQQPSDPAPIARQQSWANGTVLLSGPLIPGRLGLAFTGTFTKSSRFERTEATELDSHLASAFAHVVFTPDARNTLDIVGWVEQSETPDVNRIAFDAPLTTDVSDAVHVQATWERRLSRTSWALFGDFSRRAQSNDLPTSGTFVVDRVIDGPVPDLVTPASGSVTTWSLGGRITPTPFPVGGRQHMIRGGIVVSGANATQQSTFTGDIGELVGGVPARVWRYASPAQPSDWHSTDLAVYASDAVALHPRVALDAGLRFEAAGGSAAGSASSISWANWYPRANLRWELTDYQHIAALVGFRRYGERLLLNELAEGDPSAPFGSIYQWPASANPSLPAPGARIGPVGPGTGNVPGVTGIDPALERPAIDELVVGFESRPRADAVIRLSAIVRREQQLLGVVAAGVPASEYVKTFIPDPGTDRAGGRPLAVYDRPVETFGQDQFRLVNVPNVDATFAGVDLTIQASLHRLSLIFGATAGRSEGVAGNVGFGPLENDYGVLGDVFIDPNARTYAKGRMFTERGYTIKTAGIFTLPWDVRVGYVARYQDGQHFARLVVVSGLNQGTEEIRAFQNGQTRFQMTPTLDLRVQRPFTVSGVHLAVLFDAYNVLNTGYEVEAYDVTGPDSRLTTAVQPARALHLGVRVTF